MARVSNALRTSEDGKKSYGTYYITKNKRADSDMYFMAQEGDRCDTLASKFYGDSNLWWYIARVNELKTMNIPAGTHLRIPASYR